MNIMELSDFLNKQREIYDKFRNNKVKETGINPKQELLKGVGSYLIVFRHSLDVIESLDEFSYKVSREIPSITYGLSNAHTTISDYELGPEFIPKKQTLEKLTLATSIASERSVPKINYNEWLYNGDSIIAAGIPDGQFLEIVEHIIDNSKRLGIDLRYPWGSHITAARFTAPKKPEELRAFFELIKEAPQLGISKPKKIDLCVQRINYLGHSLSTIERFSLKN